MILVTGATGNVGRQVTAELLHTDAEVRALTRNPDTADLPGGVDVAGGDLSDPATLDAAVKGVDAVFLVWPFTTTENAPAVLHTIARKARRLVSLSAAGGQQPDPVGLFHADMERLIEQSGVFVEEPELVTHTVEDITGARARTFRQWATDHADDFR